MNRVLAMIAVLLLLVTACGSEEGERTSSRTSPSPAATGATASPGAAGTTEDGATAAPDGRSDGTDGDTDGGDAQQPQATSKPVQPAPEGGVNQPPTGTYTYDLSGTYQDPTMVSEKSYDSDDRLIQELSRSGNTYTGKSRTNSEDDNMTSTQRTRWESDKVLLTYLAVSAPPFVDFECTITPPVEFLHIPMKAETFPKQQWNNEQDDCSGSLELTVVGKEDIKDATGKTWTTWKIDNTTSYRFSGGLQGTLTGTAWFSPDLGTMIKADERNEGTAGQGDFHSHQVTLLRKHP